MKKDRNIKAGERKKEIKKDNKKMNDRKTDRHKTS